MSNPDQQPESVASTGTLPALLESFRVKHWLKNGFVLAPILFAGCWADVDRWIMGLLATAAFCVLSSAIYLLNDIFDRQVDALHPDKCSRPIPSGRLGISTAAVAAVGLILLGLFLAVLPALPLAKILHIPKYSRLLTVWAVAYLLLNLLYCIRIKRVAILDVIFVAMGFVVRALAGAAAVQVPTSPWLVLCTFTLCLYIALAKRRSELMTLRQEIAHQTRRANREYHRSELDRMLTISAALAIMTYSLYCVAERTVSHIGSAHMIWTIPVVLYGIFRFDRTSRQIHKGDVVNVFLRDKVLWLVMVIYVGMVGLIITFGDYRPIQRLLDV